MIKRFTIWKNTRGLRNAVNFYYTSSLVRSVLCMAFVRMKERRGFFHA